MAAIVAVVAALALLFTDRFDENAPGAYGTARTEFDKVVAPVAGVVAAPVRWVAQGVDFVGGYFFAVSENHRLRKEVDELGRWRDAAIALKNINNRYEALLKLRTEPPIPMVAARIVSDARGPFSNARLADAGASQGVKQGNPVISERGVVGRVVGVASNASRVLLLTDVESRTPVLIDRTNARAILTGDGGPIPRLEFVRGIDPVKEGDRVLTSGDGGLFPRGLPVGVVAKDLRGGWRVRLYTDQTGIDYVRILVFDDFSKMVDQTALENTPIPSLTPQEKAEIEAAITGKPVVAPTPPAASATPANGALLVAPATGAAPAGSRPAAVAKAPATASSTTTGAARAATTTSQTTGTTTTTAKPPAAKPKPHAAAPPIGGDTDLAPAAPTPAPPPVPATPPKSPLQGLL